MSAFPVCSSILSPSQLGLWVQEHYGRSSNTRCSVIKTGINHSYLVTDGSDRFVLRIYAQGWRTQLEIEEELRLLQHLKDSGSSVSCGIAGTDGTMIQEILAPEGLRYAAVFEYAKGQKLMQASAEQHQHMGRQIAGMHLHMKDFTLERTQYDANVVLKTSFLKLLEFMEQGTEEEGWMREMQAVLWKEWEAVDWSRVTKGAVHLDMWFDNMLVNDEGTITVFDFDFCGNGYLCMDVAYYIMQLYSLTPDEAVFREKADSFLAGYNSIRQMSVEEMRIIPMLGVSLYFFYLGIQCQRFNDWSNNFLNEVYLRRYIEVRVKKYFDYCFRGKGQYV